MEQQFIEISVYYGIDAFFNIKNVHRCRISSVVNLGVREYGEKIRDGLVDRH